MGVHYPSITGHGGRYVLNRPYIIGIVGSWVHDSIVTQHDGIVEFIGTYFGTPTRQVMGFKPEFFSWSSNRYTADWIFSDYYYENNNNGIQLTTLPWVLDFAFKPGTSELYMSVDSLGFPDLYYYKFPQAPTNFWTER